MTNIVEFKKEDAGFDVEYILDEGKKVVGITHPKWSFRIMRNQKDKKQCAFVCEETDEPFGILDRDMFNTLLMCWLLIDDPKLIDSAAK